MTKRDMDRVAWRLKFHTWITRLDTDAEIQSCIYQNHNKIELWLVCSADKMPSSSRQCQQP